MVAVSLPRIAAFRQFNRFYTRRIGLLRKTFLDTPWSLGEMRVLWEIDHGDNPTASDVAAKLDLDAGYLSRLLRGFEKDGLVSRTTSKVDARQNHLKLTPKGRTQFTAADKRQVNVVRDMLGRLPLKDQEKLVGAMGVIQSLLNETRVEAAKPAITLRQPEPGDLGWIVSRHAELYGEEYGWGPPFEGMCAQIVADFQQKFDPDWERGWIAEMDGERVGCILLVKDKPEEKRPKVSRIRLLLLDPKARGQGLGARLVDESVTFSREAGYRRVTLWTHSVLTAARAIYAKAGFRLVGTEEHDSLGQPVTSEFWDLDL
jgi:DNA-binding MarR family transcriptional regulator/GNAT superfamily N-acetyltransferase